MSPTARELISDYVHAERALREAGLLHSANQLAGDYAEYLVCKALGLDRAGASNKGFDAEGPDGRYEVKGRRLAGKSPSRQMSALRGLDGDPPPFDFLVGVLFNEDFSVKMALKVPHGVVLKRARPAPHTNSFTFYLSGKLREQPGVEDCTEAVRDAAGRGSVPHKP